MEPLTATDARGTTLTLAAPPQRIVSLVPSTTESLFALGCGERVVGITRFCVHPAEGLVGRVKVGGTKDLDMARLCALQPDLVIGNAEENTRELFAAIEAEGIPLHVAFPRTVDDALADLLALGRLVGAAEAAAAQVARIQAARARLHAQVQGEGLRYAYLIWRRPWMAINDQTFIAALLAEAGGVNVLGAHPDRYLTLAGGAAELAAAQPEVVLLSSEPFPFQEKHADELAAESGLPRARFVLVDGERCSWHGVRMAEALGYLADLRAEWARHR